MENYSLLTVFAKIGWGGGGFPGVKFLDSFKKMFLEKHINPDFSLKNLGHNLQTIGKSPLNNPFTNGPHFSKHGGSTNLNSANCHVLHLLRDIVNIAKIHRWYSWDVRGWCSDKKEGIFLSADPFKEKKSSSDPSSRPSDGRFYGQTQYN